MKNDFQHAAPRVLPMGATPAQNRTRPSGGKRFADREVALVSTPIAPLADRRPPAEEESPRTRENSGWLRYLMQVHLTWAD